MPHPLHPVCNQCWCTIAVAKQNPRLGEAKSDTFRVNAYVRTKEATATNTEAVARLLLQGSFGPTTKSIEAALTAASHTGADLADDNDQTAAEAWIAAQMKEPATLHRAYGRARSNPRFMGDAYASTAVAPCDVGSRWNRYAFDEFDIGSNIEVELLNDRYGLSVGGVRRTEVKSFKIGQWSPLLAWLQPHRTVMCTHL